MLIKGHDQSITVFTFQLLEGGGGVGWGAEELVSSGHKTKLGCIDMV